MELNSLNQKHENMLKKYIKFVQGTVYNATEDANLRKFLDFNEILQNIITYTNAIERLDKNSEWVYMAPNLMLYSCIGFLSALRNKDNNKLMDELCEKLFEETVDFMGETTDILEDIRIKKKLQRKILTKRKKINEHRN
tara:strand:- start:1979 stop:2395 length:417 start_codon:yes stop_codon:yes gene_type:complete